MLFHFQLELILLGVLSISIVENLKDRGWVNMGAVQKKKLCVAPFFPLFFLWVPVPEICPSI
jgi:energy-converting hydrogenase Eha subunit H